METKNENKNVNDELLNLAAELQEKQGYIVKGLSEFMEKWSAATAAKLGDSLDFVEIYSEFPEGLEYYIYYFERGTEKIILRKKNRNKPDYKDEYLTPEELNKDTAIKIASKLKFILTHHIDTLKSKHEQYTRLSEILDKLNKLCN
ncbi:MAG: hypothetical protein ACYCSB_04160 [bacterium]